MSAPDGLEAMIREYSELAMQTGLSQAYDKFSEEMKSRMSSLEKAVGAIATLSQRQRANHSRMMVRRKVTSLPS